MIGTIVGVTITFLLLAALFFGFWCENEERKEEEYMSSFRQLKINDRFQSKAVNDPFLVSNKQVAVIISKESSPVDKKKYVLFIYNNVKYSAEWNQFRKHFAKVLNDSKAQKMDIDTNINGEYKIFREEYINKNNDEEIAQWIK